MPSPRPLAPREVALHAFRRAGRSRTDRPHRQVADWILRLRIVGLLTCLTHGLCHFRLDPDPRDELPVRRFDLDQHDDCLAGAGVLREVVVGQL